MVNTEKTTKRTAKTKPWDEEGVSKTTYYKRRKAEGKDTCTVLGVDKERKPWQFQPGNSANPAGRPKASALEKEVRSLARQHTESAIQTLAEILTDKDATASARVSAAIAILDRGHGKPLQQIELGEAGAFSEMDDDAIDAFIVAAQAELRGATIQ